MKAEVGEIRAHACGAKGLVGRGENDWAAARRGTTSSTRALQ
eukprot:CAMPEP_0177381010 /NCGR_PEP_ID=MMETSP0368-20130122/47833_1 /TAXON_ID=447022 ORGANISM="Scrippsiella hangoei-like, Strain SHHI-4" /NCGR_SAMPLE_ID=MMETSP0368 /ASSEMBLY_ACC=CAM_ASM_000363 /LENGTH=41 /DNA_ID= /DNA_START= /DNA_END= /DNA_ORIENTATION=